MKIATAVDALNLTIERVVRVLSGRNIRVTRSGNKAFVAFDQKHGQISHVNIPSLPENAAPDLIVAIKGFIDHEVAHLLFSNFEYSAKRVRENEVFKNKVVAGMQNALEDCWIEGAMRETFGGSEHNLEDTRLFMIANFFEPEFQKRLASGELKNEMFSLAFFFTPIVRAIYGQKSLENWCSDKWDYIGEKNAKILKSFEAKIKAQSSTKDSYDLTLEILEALDANPQDEDEDKDENEDDGESEDEGDGDDDGDDEGEDEDEGDGDDEGEDEDEGDGEGKGSSGLSDEGSSDSDEDANGGENNSGGEDGGEGSEDDEDKSTPSRSGAEHGVGGASSWTDSPENQDAFETTDSVLAKIVESIYDKTVSCDDYIPFTTDFDYVGEYNPPEGVVDELGSDIKAHVLESETKSSVIRQEVVRAFTAQSQSRWQPGLKRGKLNPSSIYRISEGDDRVFRQREISKTTDIGVTLLIDCSGSMSGDKIHNAITAAFMLSQVFTQIKVKHEILGFTTGSDEVCARHGLSGLGEFASSIGGAYGAKRSLPLMTYVFKPFDKQFTQEMKEKMSAIQYSWDLQGNTDHENLLIAAKRLLAQKVSRRVLIVLSDGQTVSSGSASRAMVCQLLHKAVDDIRKSGIELLGIGLQDHSVKTFYGKDSMVISTTEGIPNAILGTIRSLIK